MVALSGDPVFVPSASPALGIPCWQLHLSGLFFTLSMALSLLSLLRRILTVGCRARVAGMSFSEFIGFMAPTNTRH